ncbi:hypothetical protein HY837_01765 [archaeon]|nr:hypothetical protein [archaeon]
MYWLLERKGKDKFDFVFRRETVDLIVEGIIGSAEKDLKTRNLVVAEEINTAHENKIKYESVEKISPVSFEFDFPLAPVGDYFLVKETHGGSMAMGPDIKYLVTLHDSLTVPLEELLRSNAINSAAKRTCEKVYLLKPVKLNVNCGVKLK